VAFLAPREVLQGDRMNKAAEAFRTISEVADELEVPKHVLRFWEVKFPQIRPMKRGGGRRYYRPEDMELLRGIQHLLHAEGYTIKGVQKIMREHGIDQVKAVAERAAKLNAVPPPNKTKRGRKALTEPVAQIPAAAPDAQQQRPAAAVQGAAQRRHLIDALLAELEICRSLLAESTSVATSGAVIATANAASRRRSVG